MNRLQEYAARAIGQNKEFEKGLAALLARNNVSVARLPGSALPLFLAALAQALARPLCIITAHSERAEQIYNDLEFFGFPDVFHFAEDESLPYEFDEPAIEILARQVETCVHLAELSTGKRSGRPSAVVASLESMLTKSVRLEWLINNTVYIEHNETIDVDKTTLFLHNAGYVRVPIVETHGEFAIRGGILDVFPLDSDLPVRVDLFGTQVESIRHFDPSTQRSLKRDPGRRVALPPAKKNLFVRQALEEGRALEPLTSLFPPETIFVLDEPEKFPARAKEFWELIDRQHAERAKSGERVTPPQALYETLESLNRQIRSRPPLIEHHLIEVEGENAAAGGERLAFHAGVFGGLQPHLETFLGIIREQLEHDGLVVIACDNDGQVQRFEELLRERHFDCVAIPSGDRQARAFHPPAPPAPCRQIVLTVGPLQGGFVLPEARLLFLTDREVFGRYKHRHMFRKLYRGTPVASVAEIQRGDYVVHVDHGIGQFLGLRRQAVDGRQTDLIEIVYQDKDRLLVPVEKIHLVQKYSAVEGTVPSLDRLGGKRWIQRKKKSQEAIEKMAEELLDLYAHRAAAKGSAYDPDTVWQSEFEASFLYPETPDQLRAIEETKEDLERPVPMDRLVCGDVGYGKTEVAMRAAFKVIQEHKQVAVLVPTTILAQQHLATFTERFADYDLRINMLSRFKSAREQREILRRLRLGELDVVIGTHRLLSRDVEFADLGLVVVDEEHRFGVRHKEKLKQLRTSVDVLTLTATPIPRTLHMALAGLRDMSVINTPPADRIPIKTSLIHFEHDLIQEAVLRELNRGGQVFFVHNRVQTIDMVARRLREIVPKASIAIAHGQMDEHQLERVMLDFVDGKHDILVSTTIIESGLDIPNVNTIIINRADALGLAQLYQLRGRVGRSARQAFAYLIVPQGEGITDTAVRRLAAIQEFVELGAGFQIAMRDMEIRGTGNILGREQHGAMAAIGFELYCDLLQKAVRKLKGEAVEAEVTTEVKWPLDAYLPEAYVPLEAQRVGIYKRLAQVRTLRAVRDIDEEVRDRYGRPPQAAETLIELAGLRVAASLCSVARVSALPQGVRLEVAGDLPSFAQRLERLRRHGPGNIAGVRLNGDGAVDLTLHARANTTLARLHEVAAILHQLAELKE